MGREVPVLAATGRRGRGGQWRLPHVVPTAALAAGLALSGAIAGCTANNTTPASATSPVGKSSAKPANAVPRYPAHSLAPARGALFGAWVKPEDWSGGSTYAEEAAVASFERTIGRNLAIDHVYTSWANPMPVALAQWDLSRGTIPMITWAGARTDLIAKGSYDSVIRATAYALKSLHGPVMLRWFPEMDLKPSLRYTVSPTSFIAAWRHMHEIFTSVGATNVRWVWCPNVSAFRLGIAQRYYPGDSYVDWVGADGYNWAPQVNFLPWRSFSQIFEPFYKWGLPTGKPMLIGEYGAVEGGPGAKARWFRQADRQIKSKFPALRAVVYFNSDHLNFGMQFNWKVTSSKTSLAAFKDFAHDPYFRATPAK